MFLPKTWNRITAQFAVASYSAPRLRWLAYKVSCAVGLWMELEPPDRDGQMRREGRRTAQLRCGVHRQRQSWSRTTAQCAVATAHRA